MEVTIFIGCVIIFVLVFVTYESNKKDKAIEEAFSGRERLSKKEFYEKYFKKLGIPEYVIYGVREILEEQLLADLSRLTKEDDFSTNIAFFWEFDSMADVEIIVALEEHFKIKIEDKEAEQTKTVGDIINLVTKKISKNALPKFEMVHRNSDPDHPSFDDKNASGMK